jgi:hypothetical protein
VPGEHRVEAVVVLGAGPDGMQADPVAELAQAVDRAHPLGRGEVVKDALRHQEVRRARLGLHLELGHLQRGVEGEVDVVAEEKRP